MLLTEIIAFVKILSGSIAKSTGMELIPLLSKIFFASVVKLISFSIFSFLEYGIKLSAISFAGLVMAQSESSDKILSNSRDVKYL